MDSRYSVSWRHLLRDVAVVLTLMACVPYEPHPLSPLEELNLLQQRTDGELRIEPTHFQRRSWFPLETDVRFEDGLSLGEANAVALFYSPRILEARAQARLAQAQVLRRGILDNPDLFLGPRLSTDDQDLILPLSASWNLPVWGTREARVGVAEAELVQRRHEVSRVELDVLQEVREKFIRLDRAYRVIRIWKETASTVERVVGWAEGLHRAGEVDDVTVYLVRAERDDVVDELEIANQRRRQRYRELLHLLGLVPDAEVTPLVEGMSDSHSALEEASRDLLLRLPQLKAAEAAYAVAESELRLEVRKQYPELRLGPEFENDRGDVSLGLGIGIELPIFDTNEEGILVAQEARDRARLHYRAALLDATHKEAAARQEVQASRMRLERHRTGAMRHMAQAVEALEVRMRLGHTDVLEVLSAGRSLARSRHRLVELEETSALAQLRAAVAGGLTLKNAEAPTIGRATDDPN